VHVYKLYLLNFTKTFSVLTLLVGQGIWPVKTECWGTGMVACSERGANDLHMVQLIPLPPHHLLLQ